MIIFDFETTGFSNIKNEIIEIGAMKIDKDLKEIETFEQLVKPEEDIPKVITNLTGITNKMVKDCPTSRVVLKNFRSFCGKEIMIAHNGISFDGPFFYSSLKKAQLQIPENVLWDSLFIAKYYVKRAQKHNMKYLTEFFGIKQDDAHRSFSDVKDLQQILQKIKENYSWEQMEAAAHPVRLRDLENFRCKIPLEFYKFANEKKFFEVRGRVDDEVKTIVARPIMVFKKNKENYFLARVKGGGRVKINFKGMKVISENC